MRAQEHFYGEFIVAGNNEIHLGFMEGSRYIFFFFGQMLTKFTMTKKEEQALLIFSHYLIKEVAYGGETWTMTKKEEQALLIFSHYLIKQVAYGGETWTMTKKEEQALLIF